MENWAFLQGGGEMGERMRAHDWSTSPLGDPAGWPQSLRSVVGLMINSRYPMFCAWGPDLAFLYNDGYIPIFGAKHPHTLGLPFREVWSEIWGDIAPLVDSALAGTSTYNKNLHLVMLRNGYPEDTWYDFSYSPVRDESGAVAGLFCACAETTAQVLADRRSSAEREKLFELSRDLFGVANFQGKLLSINPAWSRLLGRTDAELLARPFAEIIHPDDLRETAAVLAKLEAGEAVDQFHVRLLKPDGEAVSLAWSAVPDESPGSGIFYTVGRDVGDELRREEALRQSQKLEALGQLTGGLAHDFNNLLQVAHGNLDLIRRDPGDPARVARLAGNGMQATERGTRLTAQLLAFSRAQKLELVPTATASLIGSMQDMLRRSLGPMVRLEIDPGSDQLGVLVDPTQLEMALLNLAINARDAMPAGGTLAIAAEAMIIDDADLDLPAGDYVAITVSDDGAGMPADVARRAFDPFFTTKGIGKGTGLGLSQVYAMARQAGGIARIAPREPSGTCVTLLLKAAQPEQRPASEAHEVTAAKAEPRTVLVVDDDPGVREFLADSLESLGFDVVVAEDGEQGLALLVSVDPDLMLLDFAMPGMNGAEVAAKARTLHPGLPIVFASGYSDTASLDRALGEGAVLVRKPFDVDDLLRAFDTAFAAGS